MVRSSGTVNFLNEDISRSQTHHIVRKGWRWYRKGEKFSPT
jgi:branched-chain amino acid transport system ATP-binding protein